MRAYVLIEYDLGGTATDTVGNKAYSTSGVVDYVFLHGVDIKEAGYVALNTGNPNFWSSVNGCFCLIEAKRRDIESYVPQVVAQAINAGKSLR